MRVRTSLLSTSSQCPAAGAMSASKRGYRRCHQHADHPAICPERFKSSIADSGHEERPSNDGAALTRTFMHWPPVVYLWAKSPATVFPRLRYSQV